MQRMEIDFRKMQRKEMMGCPGGTTQDTGSVLKAKQA